VFFLLCFCVASLFFSFGVLVCGVCGVVFFLLFGLFYFFFGMENGEEDPDPCRQGAGGCFFEGTLCFLFGYMTPRGFIGDEEEVYCSTNPIGLTACPFSHNALRAIVWHTP